MFIILQGNAHVCSITGSIQISYVLVLIAFNTVIFTYASVLYFGRCYFIPTLTPQYNF